MKNLKLILTLCLCAALIMTGCSGGDDSARDVSDSGSSEWEAVDQSIEDTVSSQDYQEGSTEDKASMLQEQLQEQYEAGNLAEEPVYDEEEQLISYVYNDGSLGGVSLTEVGDQFDGAVQRPESSYPQENVEFDEIGDYRTADLTEDLLMSAVDIDALQVAVMDGFEDTEFRRTFYEDLDREWNSAGLQVYTDYDTTVEDMKGLSGYDAIVIAMHGGMFRNHPVMSLDEEVTAATDEKYRSDRCNQLIARVYCNDKRYHYWILPEFFSNYYNTGDLEGSVIYVQCCNFFGCDCTSTSADTSMADTFRNAGAAVVIGYHNKVGSNYGRNMMKEALEQMFYGATAETAVENAKDTYGQNDNWENPTEDKYYAYPVVYGMKDTAFARKEPEESAVNEIYEEEPGESAVSEIDEEELLYMYYDAFEAGDYVYYAFADLDEDDLPELIVTPYGLSDMSDGMYADTVDIYTIRDDNVVDAGWINNSFQLIRYDSTSRTLRASWGGCGVDQYYTVNVQGSQTVNSYLTHDLDHDTYDIDGTELSEGEYQSYLKEWEKGDLLEFKAY